jgi:hypothetical protein
MQEVLVDRGELVLQRLIEKFQDLGIALHGGPLGFSEMGVRQARDCMPESSRRASNERGQTANSVRGEEKKAGVAQWPNDADRAAFASGTHLPQQVPTPSSRLMSRSEVAPSLTAARICRSDTALHTQTIIGLL